MAQDNFDHLIASGARNLLVECGHLQSGDEVLIVHEDPALGWYDADAPRAVAREAEALGLSVEMMQVGAPKNALNGSQQEAIEQHQNVIFFSRLGDQHRFEPRDPHRFTRVMSYIRSLDMLASDYGCTSHRAMNALKNAVNSVLLNAQHIDITCPKGTRFSGTVSPNQQADGDVTVRRFPLGVPIPLLADTFSGQIVLADHLTPTGSKVYEPAILPMEEPVVASIKGGRIQSIDGREDVAAKVRAHYDHVASLFGLDKDVVHSWHAGIHPGLRYDRAMDPDPDRWSNTAFVSFNYLHFHTCGAYPPGEICWMIAEPSVMIEGVELWDAGQLRPENFSETASALQDFPELSGLFRN